MWNSVLTIYVAKTEQEYRNDNQLTDSFKVFI